MSTPPAAKPHPADDDEQVTRDILDTIEPPWCRWPTRRTSQGWLRSPTQLAEIGRPFVVGLNMTDEAAIRGIEIDAKGLAGLGVDVPWPWPSRLEGVGPGC